MNNSKSVWVGLIVVALIAIGAFVYASQRSNNLGASGTRFPNGLSADTTSPTAGQVRGTSFLATGSLTVSSAGTAIAGLEFGTCSPSFSSADLAASTTAVGICTDSTVAAGDKFVVTQRFTGASTGLPSMGLFPVIAVIASTTGQYGIQVANFTGAASTSINTLYRTYSVLYLR